MAYSKQTLTSLDATINLTECGICLCEMVNPKALPCLHSFCLKCLKEVKHPPGIFLCPLCQEEIVLPPEGVDGFRDNFFINQLKDRQVISSKGKIRKPCVSCRAEEREIVARCIECNGFICQQCVDLHQTITIMKVHSVFTIDELQSGRIDMSKVMKEENCHKHKDQVLRWFCETCNIPICLACTVMEHRHPDHDYITIESANEAHVKEINVLMEGCKSVIQQLMNVIVNTEEEESKLAKSVDNIKKQLVEEKKTYLDAIERSCKEMMDTLSKIQEEKTEKIGNIKKELHNKKSKLSNAVEVASQVITSGSKNDLASNYSTLSETLTDLQQVKATGVSKGFSEILFRPRTKSKLKILDLGSISPTGPYSKHENGKWDLERVIGNEGPGKINSGIGVIVTKNMGIFIADSTDRNVKIFGTEGNFKGVLQGNLNIPHDVVITPDGTHQYVTDRTGFVLVFNSQGKRVKQFPAISPYGKASNTDGSMLYGMAVDNNGNILAGSNNKYYISNNKYYISKHMLDGTHIGSFKTNIPPWFITVTHQGRIIVCPNQNNTDAEILDHTGKLLHTINKPPDAKSWQPCGSCCSGDGIVYVTSRSYTHEGGIYSYTEDGTYLGCVTRNVIQALGIASIDDDRLVVTQHGNPAKIFSYKET